MGEAIAGMNHSRGGMNCRQRVRWTTLALQFSARRLLLACHSGGTMKLQLAILFLIVSVAAHAADNRPKIIGIDHVDFYTTAADLNAHLYVSVLGLGAAGPVEPGQSQRFVVG